MPTISVTRTYLEMTAPQQLKAALLADPSLVLERVNDCTPATYRFLYGTVGERYHWVDRRAWSDDEIRAHVGRPEITIWVLRQAGKTAGYFELARQGDDSIEIAYFGLMQEYLGKGLGKHLLTLATERAWAMGARRVWLHTCTLDHAAALPNYVRRGFAPFKTEVYETNTPAPA